MHSSSHRLRNNWCRITEVQSRNIREKTYSPLKHQVYKITYTKIIVINQGVRSHWFCWSTFTDDIFLENILIDWLIDWLIDGFLDGSVVGWVDGWIECVFLILINSIVEMHSFMKVNYCAVIHHLQEDRLPVFKPITLPYIFSTAYLSKITENTSLQWFMFNLKAIRLLEYAGAKKVSVGSVVFRLDFAQNTKITLNN